MSQPFITVAAVAVLVAGVAGYTAFHAAKTAETVRVSAHDRPVWTETNWPFLIDQWGQGWAYQCKASDCGTEVNLYLRPKIGFCNCQTGVADDAELDRVGDADLVGGASAALGPGRSIMVHGMKGRSRGYAIATPSARSVLSLAFNNRCDVVVATVIAGNAPLAQEPVVLEFLNGDLIGRWAEQVLGL